MNVELAKAQGWLPLRDHRGFVNRIQFRESATKIFTVAQRRVNHEWCCTCMAFRRDKDCKHLESMRPMLERIVGNET